MMDIGNSYQAAGQDSFPLSSPLGSTVHRMSLSSKKVMSRTSSRAPAVTESPEVIREKAIKILSSGLGKLGRTADGMHYAYLNLRLENQQLATLAGIDAFPHLQHVQVAHNQVEDLTPLAALPYLTTLEASHNRLMRVWSLDGAEASGTLEGKDAGKGGAAARAEADESTGPSSSEGGPSSEGEAGSQVPRRVLRMDVSYNLLRSLRGLSVYQLLRVLVVDNNELLSLEGLANMKSLQHLSVRNNRLQGLDHLTGLTLKSLDVSNNNIPSLEPLASVPSLEVLIAASNALSRLAGAHHLARLTTLDVSQNKGIARLEEVRHLMALPLLRRFRFVGTGMAAECDARLHVLYRLPALTELDGAEVHPREKVTATNLHGADAAARAAIRRKYFPNGEFEDTIVGGQAAAVKGLDRSASRRGDGVTADSGTDEGGSGIDSVARPLMRAMRLVGKSLDNVGRATAGPTMLKPQASSRFLLSTGTAGFTRQTSALLGMSTRGAGGGAGDLAAQERADTVPEELLREILAGGQGGLQPLAGHLAEGGESEYEVARACFLWVVQNVCRSIEPSPSQRGHDQKGATGQGPVVRGRSSGQAAPLLDLLLEKCHVAGQADTSAGAPSLSRANSNAEPASPGASGAPWAERVSLLFVALAQACQLEAAAVHGLAKGPSFESAADGGAMVGLAGIKARGKGGKPETGLEPHCWSAVKVTGKWKLLDCAWACSAGPAMDDHFFCPPDEFIYHHFPKKERWQLLDSPVTLTQFCALPTCTPAFFRYRMQLLACPTASLKLPPGSCVHHLPLGVPAEVSVLHRLVPMSLADRDARGADDSSAASLCSWTLSQREELCVSLYSAFPSTGEFLLEVFAYDKQASADADAGGPLGDASGSDVPSRTKPEDANGANGTQDGSLAKWPSFPWGQSSAGGKPCRYDRVLAYRVSTSVSCPGERFPEQSPHFTERGCSLRMPLEGFLVPGRSNLRQKFALTAPGASGLMLLVRPRPAESSNPGKEREGSGWWSGALGVPPTAAQELRALEAPGNWTGDKPADSMGASYLCMRLDTDADGKGSFFTELDLVECTRRMRGPLALVVVGCFNSEDGGGVVPLLVFPIVQGNELALPCL